MTNVVEGAEEIAAELSRQVSSADAKLQKVSGEVQKAVVENSAEVVKDLEKVGEKVKSRLEDATAELKRRGVCATPESWGGVGGFWNAKISLKVCAM